MSEGEAKSAAAPARAVDDDTDVEGEICAICLESLPRFGQGITWLTCCGKIIHKDCAAQFMNSRCDKNCPMCRAPVASDEQQHTRALRWAGKGKAWAMVFVACDFDVGRGVTTSKKMARLWYEKATEQGDPNAQYNLGLMHHLGEGGLPLSKEKARLLYEKAAEQGYANAQYNLGCMHYNGEGGLPVSKERAPLWLKRAAEQGYPDAQYSLGCMIYLGEGGLPVSKEKALLWLKRASEQGHEDATKLIDAAFKTMCLSCGKMGTMKCCSRCKCAYYCSRHCQAAAWKSGHKATC